jgi:hypothetical protein
MRFVALLPFVVLAVVVQAACGSSSDSPPDPDTDLPNRRAQDGGANDGSSNGVLDGGMLDGNAPSTTCTIALDATVAGTTRTSGDDNFELYVNGTLVKDFGGLWTDPQTDAVTLFRHPAKKNVIAVRASNVVKVDGLDRMIIIDLGFDAGGGPKHVVTDATWLRSPGGLETNWYAVDFAEANWTAPTVVGNHGDPPWGAILGTSDAKFLWSYHSGMVDQTTKPDAETVWFRKTFYLDLGGAPQSTPGACL